MNVDSRGIVRNDCGQKVAVFRDRELAERVMKAAALLTEAEAAAIVRANNSGGASITMRRVIRWEVVE